MVNYRLLHTNKKQKDFPLEIRYSLSMSRQIRKRRIALVIILILSFIFFIPWAASRLFRKNIVTFRLENIPHHLSHHNNTVLKVGTYNIAHGRGLKKTNWTGESEQQRKQRLKDIGLLLKEQDLDIIVLNEVDFNSAWSAGINQAIIIAESSQIPFVVAAPSFYFRVGILTFCFGNALLSRFPIKQAAQIDLPGYSWLETLAIGKKQGISVVIETPIGPVQVLGIHLSYRSEALRVESVRVLQSSQVDPSIPTIIMGDTNSSPPTFPFSEANEAGENAMDVLDGMGVFQRRPMKKSLASSFTYPSSAPNRIIDWILIPQRWVFENYEVLDTNLSDHRPVIATIRP